MKKLGFYVNKKIVYVDFERTKNKNAYIKITKENNILVTAPKNMPQRQVEVFVQKHIKSFLRYIKNSKKNKLYSLKESFIFLNGKKLKIKILTGFNEKKIKINNNIMYLMVKEGNEDECEKLIFDFLKKYLIDYISKRQRVFEAKLNVPLHKIRVSNKTSTWGSNNLNTISISYALRLAHFSKNVIDYIIIHELSHFHVPNHSTLFWSVVKNAMPKYKVYQKQLRSDQALKED